ncbi:MAG: hypothetical protein ACKO6K_01705 [Chitinophagaceae bacterium]
MQRKDPDVDVTREVLLVTLTAKPDSSFLQSLLQQYDNRGGLSKKQLQGLWKIASQVGKASPAWLATLEAMIRQRPTRYSSPLPAAKPLFEKDQELGQLINDILQKIPDHKSVLLIRSKYDHHEVLSPAEINTLKNVHKLLNR